MQRQQYSMLRRLICIWLSYKTRTRPVLAEWPTRMIASIWSASLGVQLEFLLLDQYDNSPTIDLSKHLHSYENGALVVSHSLCPQTSQSVEEVLFCAHPCIFSLLFMKKPGAAPCSVILDYMCLDSLSQTLPNPEWADHELQRSAQCGQFEEEVRQEWEEGKKKAIIRCRVRLKLLGLRLWGQEKHTNNLLRIRPGKHWNWQFAKGTSCNANEVLICELYSTRRAWLSWDFFKLPRKAVTFFKMVSSLGSYGSGDSHFLRLV